jgi:hypothetical protein
MKPGRASRIHFYFPGTRPAETARVTRQAWCHLRESRGHASAGTAPWHEGGCSVCRELEVRTPRGQRRLFDLRSDFTSKLPSQVSSHRKLILCIPWILVTLRPVSRSPRRLSTSVAWCYLNSSHMPFIYGGVGRYSQHPNVIPITARAEYFTRPFSTEIHTNCRDNTRGRRSGLVRQRGWHL